MESLGTAERENRDLMEESNALKEQSKVCRALEGKPAAGKQQTEGA